MKRYICLGCGYENNFEEGKEETCPYCGEYLKEVEDFQEGKIT